MEGKVSRIRQLGDHREGCSALEDMEREHWSSPWFWPEARENDGADLVVVTCVDADCTARLVITPSSLPGGRHALNPRTTAMTDSIHTETKRLDALQSGRVQYDRIGHYFDVWSGDYLVTDLSLRQGIDRVLEAIAETETSNRNQPVPR
jgi:hypothetical protein